MKIIDGFMFYNEIEILKIRLEELYDIVDYFIIVEATKTHNNTDKILYYEENKELFKKYSDKIIHIITDFNENYEFTKFIKSVNSNWFRENYQRECIQNSIKKLNLNDDDIIIISDCDEIPKRSTIYDIKNNRLQLLNTVYSLEMSLYYYNIELTTNRKWYHAKVLHFNTYKKFNLLNDIRFSEYTIIPNAGYHLSYFGDVNHIKKKVESFAESIEYTTESKDIGYLKDCYDKNILHFNKEQLIHIPLEKNENVPRYFKNQKNYTNQTNQIDKKIGWLVNDCLTCIPGVKTFWHDLLNWFPDLQDKTGGYTDYSVLPNVIESMNPKPAYIIRNGSYFRKLNMDVTTFCLIQDIMNESNQIEVIQSSDIVVFNTYYVFEKYKQYINNITKVRICPLGVNFDIFKPTSEKYDGVLSNSILYIGSSLNYPKGFNIVKYIIENTDHNFCLIMKDNFSINDLPLNVRHRVTIFNKVNQETVCKIINSCICAICTSYEETQHLSGIECGACNIPIVAREVGIYSDCKNDKEWGLIANDTNFIEKIKYVVENKHEFSPREYFIKKYSVEICRENWINIIKEYT